MYGENCQFVGVVGGFEQVVWVGVIVCWGVGIDIVYVGDIVVIVGVVVVVQYIVIVNLFVIEVVEDLFWCVVEIDVQMIDQFQFVVGVNLCEQ